jgi:fructose-specific component phosphotransferase system IIB-like protein
MGKSLLIVAVGLGVVFPQPASSLTWYVDGSVTASGDGMTWETAFRSIQEGIDASSDADTVIVAEGTYVENIRFNGKNITLTSTDPLDSTVVANTIIDGNQSGSVVTFSGTENETCTLSGFTIRNGRAGTGAGIHGYMEPWYTHATIENNLITDNVAQNAGGGLFACLGTIRDNLITRNSCGIYGGGGLSSCDGNIVNNTISFNSGRWGGGLSSCDGAVENNLIIGNEAEQYGGGVYDCWGVVQKNTIIENHAAWHGGGLSSCRAKIQNNVIAGNTADGWGGGIYGCRTVINNTIVGNFADLGGGLASCGGIIKNCIVWGNNDNYGYQLVWSADPLYSCIEGWLGGGEGNIAPPSAGFIDPDGPDGNPETHGDNDYHLSVSSPCIDAGAGEDALTDDMDGELRPQGAGTDIGADEYTDTDEDALPDYWEWKYFGDLGQDASADSDSDGLTNAEELVLSTNPNKNDTDGDGFSDGDEVASGTDPNSASSVPPEADIYVNGVLGDDANDGARPLTAKKTIQAGIDSAQDGNTVVVTEGIYFENIKFNGKNVILRSMNPSDPACVANTVIDGNRAGSVVTFDGTEDETCVLTGFTIRNGDADYGGGICGGRDSNYTHATVRNNVITANSAIMGGGVSGCAAEIRENIISANGATQGGGLYTCGGIIENNVISGNAGSGLYSCHGVIQNNLVTENWASDGAGIMWSDALIQANWITDNHASRRGGGLAFCHGTIRNNIIKGNSAWAGGGGLYLCSDNIQSNIIVDNHVDYYQGGGGGLAICYGIENNLIAGNSAPSGGGLYWCSGSIQNNTIVGNTAFSGSGAAIYDREARSTIRNCIIWGNNAADGTQLYDTQTPSYSCIEDWAGGGEGNIGADPRFLDADGPDDDPYTFDDNDYRLSADSPCIDAGVNYLWFTWPQQDLDGNCRFVGGSVDMGCYEYGSSPDADGDLVSDAEEAALGTDPNLEDTDGDSLRDGVEALRGSDPLTATPSGILNVPSSFSTIQFALFLSGDGDEIVVSPGTYYENLVLYGPDVILRSTDPTDPNVVASTVLDGRGLAPVVSFSGIETESCVLAGFTIRNGMGGICGRSYATIQHNTVTNNSSQSGGGISHCHGLIRHNTITGNIAGSGGGLSYCDGVIEHNLITQNSAVGGTSSSGAGGGLYFCGGTIQNNVISKNTATGSGGGLASCDAMIDGNIVAANSAANDGGGLYDCGGNIISVPPAPPKPVPIISSNLIVGNLAKRGGGVSNILATIRSSTIVGNAAEEGGGLYDCRTILNCVIWGNTAAQLAVPYGLALATHSCIQDWTGGGEGNISDDPQFVDPNGPDGDPQTWEDNNYRLSPSSPCIDTGANEAWMWEAVDLDGNPRIWNATVDMGAYEYGSFHFKLTQVTESAGRHLTWSSRPGDTYTVWSCGDLAVGDWILEATVASEGDATSWRDVNAGESPQKFYRIQIYQ